MIRLNLVIVLMYKFLNNLKIFKYKFIQQTYAYLRGCTNRVKMDQNVGGAREDHDQPEVENAMEQDPAVEVNQHQYEPLQNLAVGELVVNLGIGGMDVADDSSNESDYEDANYFAEIDDNDDEDDDHAVEDDDDEDAEDEEDEDGEQDNTGNNSELDDIMDQDSCSSEEFELLLELDTICNFKLMHGMFLKRHQELKKPAYTFQPLRLIKCLYKSRHDSLTFPIARSGHRITASESHLYSLGGYNPNRTTNAMRRASCKLFQELWAYNFATNRWKLLQNADNSDMPRELASNALIMHNNILISHGGTGFPFGQTCSNDCYVYTTGENPLVVPLKASGDFPAAQYGPSIVIHKDYLYTIGGTTGFDYSCDVYRLNLKTKVWENVYISRPEMRDDPEGRYRHEVVYDGQYVYVLGGGTANAVYDLQRIPAFNLETNRWDYFDTLPDRTASTPDNPGYPKARKCLSCVQHTLSNGDIEAFITGGLQVDFTTYFNDIWKLNLRTKHWYKIQSASLPRPLYFHSAAHSGNGCMYIFGGIQYSEKDMCRRNDLFKMWMTIPKLSEICWDAITYYNADLHHFDRNKLLRSGIPERFVNRLPPPEERRRNTFEPDEPSPSSLIRSLPKRMRFQIE